MEVKKKIEKRVSIYKRLLYGPDAPFRKTENRPVGKSMYYNEEERDMVIAKLLFYGIIAIAIFITLLVLAIIIF